jgi:hypothetical protein
VPRWYSPGLIGRQRDRPLEHRIAPRRVVGEGHHQTSFERP